MTPTEVSRANLLLEATKEARSFLAALMNYNGDDYGAYCDQTRSIQLNRGVLAPAVRDQIAQYEAELQSLGVTAHE